MANSNQPNPDLAKAVELYDQDMSDNKIAQQIGFAEKTVAKWRENQNSSADFNPNTP